MRRIHSISIIITFIFLLSSFSTGYWNTSADQVPPAVSTIAEKNENIVLDGKADEWSNDSLIYVDIFPQEPHDPPILVQTTINFAYDDDYLYGFVYIPDTYGYVSAMELLFFGRSSQSGTADGVFINATENFGDDHGFGEMSQEPFSDVSKGGSNNVQVYAFSGSGGAYFEFKKDLHSGDSAGLDFDLYEGASIAVYLVAWIGGLMPNSPPNWGMLFTEDNWIRYIRLSIGYDNGEQLEIQRPGEPKPINWIISDEIYQAVYISDDASQFNLDGKNNEEMWSRGATYHVRQYLTKDDGYDSTMYYDGDITILYDSTYLYIYFQIYDENDDEGDFVVFLLSTSERMLAEDLGNTDVVAMDTHGYTDMRFEANTTSPKPDIEFGGTSDGDAYVTYYDNMRHVEFRKELNSGDTKGADLAVVDLSQYAFIVIMTGYQAPPDGPNYGDFTTDSEGKPAIQIHCIQFLPKGQEPTGNIDTKTSNENTNTFVIGSTLTDSLLLITSSLILIVMVRLYSKKRNIKKL